LIAYIDSSVILRIVLGQPSQLDAWDRLERPVASELVRVECLRTIDRARLANRLDDGTIAARRAGLLELLEGLELVALEQAILDRAADPFPTSISTLDALHLATALAIRDDLPSLAFATHDLSLGNAAAAMGFEVLGLKAAASPGATAPRTPEGARGVR
jgi:predicted nucleic acid-binding protein